MPSPWNFRPVPSMTSTRWTDDALDLRRSEEDGHVLAASRRQWQHAGEGDSLPGARDIVIAASEDGIGATWTSVTDSQVAGTAAELVNLAGAPFVLGTVGAVVALDAKPRGRAKRAALATNADRLPSDLDTALATQLETVLPEAEDDGARIAIQPIKRVRDLPDDAWIVFTKYALSEDGTALRASAEVGHSDDVRFAMELEAERRRQSMDQGYRGSNYRIGRLSNRAARNEQIRRARARGPQPNALMIYHSDPIALPAPGDLTDDDKRQMMEDRIERALDSEREARRAGADRRYARAVTDATSEKKAAKALRKRDKAYAKADKVHAKALAKARDGELSKTESLMLASRRWNAVPDTAEQSRIDQAIAAAHDFFAEALARSLPGLSDTDAAETPRSLTEEERLRGTALLEEDEDGRRVLQILKGDSRGTVLSLPENGAAEYGRQTADP